MENVSLYVSIGGAIVAIIGALSQFTRLHLSAGRSRQMGDAAIGDAAESISVASKNTIDQLLDRVTKLEERNEKLEGRNDVLEMNEKRMLEEIREMKVSQNDWQDWAWRLVYQLKSHGLDPVPFKLGENKN